jgi:hypothetical protein
MVCGTPLRQLLLAAATTVTAAAVRDAAIGVAVFVSSPSAAAIAMDMPSDAIALRARPARLSVCTQDHR